MGLRQRFSLPSGCLGGWGEGLRHIAFCKGGTEGGSFPPSHKPRTRGQPLKLSVSVRID